MINYVVLIAGLVGYGSITPVLGQVSAMTPPGENLTITVTGEARGKPDLMYIELASEATAGNAADAFQQCKRKADAAVDAVGALKIPNSEILRRMYEFSSPTAGAPYAVMQPTAAPAGTKVSQVIKVKVKIGDATGMDKLGETICRIFDAANKTGVGLKQASAWQAQVMGRTGIAPVRYALEDATPLRKKAITDALQKAKDMKNSLIASGIPAGRLVGVGYHQVGQAGATVYWPGPTPDQDVLGEKSASSSTPEQVVVRCPVTFTYKIERPLGLIEEKEAQPAPRDHK